MLRSILFFLFFLVALLLTGAEDEESHQLVKCSTTKGDILIDVNPEWAPRGARRFLELVADGFYTDIGMFRCVNKFLTQFGISDNPKMQHWHRDSILGFLSYTHFHSLSLVYTP